MGILDDMADDLAQQTMQIIEATGDQDIEREMAAILGTSSQTLEEAYLTAMRVRKAEKRARELLANKRKAAGMDRPQPPVEAPKEPAVGPAPRTAAVKRPDTSA